MKRYQSTLTKMTRPVCMALAALLMVGAMASCSENENTETALSDNAYLSLSFSTGTGNSTRAGETSGKALADNETDANPTQESDIHNIKVWVFKSNTGDDATPISYKAETLSEVMNGNYTLNLRFLRKIGGEEVKNIDLYILANSESINMPDQIKGKDLSSVTRKDLKEVSFTSPFGINSNGTAENQEVPAGKGLPISRAITEISVDSHVADTEEGAKDKGIKIPLVRAVSKLHFYFARKSGNDANTSQVKVTRIEVEGNTIPTASYVFPDEAIYNEDGYNQNVTSQKYNSSGTAYVSYALKLAGVENQDIREVDNPESFIKKNQSAQEYLDAFKQAGIDSHNLCYLRETNKAIKGTIWYSLDGGTPKSATFNIPSEGNAIRNRELVVYGYFLNGQMGKLTVTPSIQEWQDGGTFDFIDASTNVEIPDSGKTDWGYKVYYGFPKRGPMITLKDIDTKGKPWILQTDNPMFGFVECDENGKYLYDPNAKTDLYNDGEADYRIKDFIINEEGKTETLRFYVVPKNRLDLAKPHNVKAQVFLTKYPNDKFILNPGLRYKGCREGKLAGKDIHFEQVL
ncbi:hypothetical protein [Segatella copri]|uniref:Major fimbrial subunit protein N-terminal domain-containing protein n=1 Tax=Segatella copri TaxID=165179 RepID=A0AAW9TCS4_9BACT|nr:hypothetical protein [Segatella copri]MQN27137.1 hypothetical protein [Segatella copri]MQN30941.1 hypothetical protein [Segatella copri]MQN37481.1 hypothetical protein [Segatella copri]MQN75128.1 hypothetical protein [Segatella copri]MQO27195.1 hypothetical protein [Segatella copri]